MGGNFGQMTGMSEDSNMIINADGTGKLEFDENSGDFAWTQEGADSIWVSPQSDEVSTQQAILVTYKDDALFVPMEQDGQTVTLIFTKDGTYAGAKQITLDGAKPITSESQLLGKWTLVGMNMGGISMYGDAEAMKAAMGGTDASLTFKESGTIEQESGEATWAIDANGATMTSTDITGTNTVPIVAVGDDIAIDYSQTYGMEFIILMSKAA